MCSSLLQQEPMQIYITDVRSGAFQPGFVLFMTSDIHEFQLAQCYFHLAD